MNRFPMALLAKVTERAEAFVSVSLDAADSKWHAFAVLANTICAVKSASVRDILWNHAATVATAAGAFRTYKSIFLKLSPSQRERAELPITHKMAVTVSLAFANAGYSRKTPKTTAKSSYAAVEKMALKLNKKLMVRLATKLLLVAAKK